MCGPLAEPSRRIGTMNIRVGVVPITQRFIQPRWRNIVSIVPISCSSAGNSCLSDSCALPNTRLPRFCPPPANPFSPLMRPWHKAGA